jgi:biotin carboxyl carrier protein
MFAFNQRPAAPSQPTIELAMHTSPVVSDYSIPDPPADPIPVSEPDSKEQVVEEVVHENPVASAIPLTEPVASANPLTMPVAEPTNELRVSGTTEPAPGRFAKLPLATSQAVAFVDVKAGDRVKKGWQVFSHWESPERLQAVKNELERTRKLGDVAKARSAAALQNVERLKKLKGSVTAQEFQDAQTNAAIRHSEYEAAQLAIAQAESHFTAMEFEFTQAFVTSPIDGIVVSVDVVQGERRQLNGPFRGVTVLDTTVLYCRCLLNQDQLAKFQRLGRGPSAPGNRQTVDASEKPEIQVTIESDGQEFAAKIVWIGVQADAASGHIPVLLEVNNPVETLRCGVQTNVCFSLK